MEKEEEGRQKVANIPPSEPVLAKVLRPKTSKPPTRKPNTPLPCATRDTTPNPETGIYKEISKLKKGPENQSERASEREKETLRVGGNT